MVHREHAQYPVKEISASALSDNSFDTRRNHILSLDFSGPRTGITDNDLLGCFAISALDRSKKLATYTHLEPSQALSATEYVVELAEFWGRARPPVTIEGGNPSTAAFGRELFESLTRMGFSVVVGDTFCTEDHFRHLNISVSLEHGLQALN